MFKKIVLWTVAGFVALFVFMLLAVFFHDRRREVEWFLDVVFIVAFSTVAIVMGFVVLANWGRKRIDKQD